MDIAGPFPPGVWPGVEPGDEVRRAVFFLLVAYQLLTPEEVATRRANLADARMAAGVEGDVVDVELPDQSPRLIYFTMPLESKGSAHVIPAMQAVINEICRMFQAPVVYRIHGDRAGELTGPAARLHFEAAGIVITSTPGYEPNNNGRAERGIGIMQGRSRTLLMALPRVDAVLAVGSSACLLVP